MRFDVLPTAAKLFVPKPLLNCIYGIHVAMFPERADPRELRCSNVRTHFHSEKVALFFNYFEGMLLQAKAFYLKWIFRLIITN